MLRMQQSLLGRQGSCYIDGVAEDCGISDAVVMEIVLAWTKLLAYKWCHIYQ